VTSETQGQRATTGVPEPPVVAALRARREGAVRGVASNAGQFRVTVERDALVDFAGYLKNEATFDFLVDLTAVDEYPSAPRFRMVYVFRSMSRREELLLECVVPEDDCRIPSLCALFLCANALERECYDMFGIEFTGHPDLRRILMPEMFTDFPMRKDFPMQGRMSDQEWAEWIIARAQRTEGDQP
jgi:NADH-quinone oxidoreductase subunit C